MNILTNIGNYALSNAVTIFVISFLIFIGRNLDKFVKKQSRVSFAKDFLRTQKINYLNAAEISLDGLDRVFKSRKLFFFTIPKITRIYIVSIVIAGSLMLFYLLISFNNFNVGSLVVNDESISQPILMFDLDGRTEFIFLALLPLLIFVVNPILDVFSYSETRFLLKFLITLLRKSKKYILPKIIFICILDLFYSFCLFVFFIYSARRLYTSFIINTGSRVSDPTNSGFFDSIKFAYTESYTLLDSYFSGLGVDGLYGGILISTFVSTLFVWFVYFSYVLSVFQKYFSRLLLFINKHTHILRIFYRKPFSIISYFLASIAITVDICVKFISS